MRAPLGDAPAGFQRAGGSASGLVSLQDLIGGLFAMTRCASCSRACDALAWENFLTGVPRFCGDSPSGRSGD